MQPSFKFSRSLPSSFLVLLSLLGYLLLAFFFPLIPNYGREPVADIRTFAPSLLGGVLYALLLLVLFALHALLYKRLSTTWTLSLKRVIGITCLLAIPLLIMYPINANDVYRYVMRGLISSKYQSNPYENSPIEFGAEINLALAGEWADATSPYGPLWELSASVLTSIGQDNLLLNLLLFKMLGVFSLILAGIILWNILGIRTHEQENNNNRRLALVVLFVWNPALLLDFVANAHNDALMIAVLLLGWFVVKRGRFGPGFLVMLAAVLIKPIALLTLPIVFIFSWRDLESLRSRLVYLAWILFGGVGLLAIAFFPFGDPILLVGRLLSEASAGASFSPITLIILLASELGFAVSISRLALVATVLFGLFYIWLLWRVWQRKSTEQNLAFSFWGYILQALNFRIWYAAWPFPWLILDAYRMRDSAVFWLHTSLWFLVTSQLSVIIYGHLRTDLLGSSHLLAHLIGILFVFLLPAVLARYSRKYDPALAAGKEHITVS